MEGLVQQPSNITFDIQVVLPLDVLGNSENGHLMTGLAWDLYKSKPNTGNALSARSQWLNSPETWDRSKHVLRKNVSVMMPTILLYKQIGT